MQSFHQRLDGLLEICNHFVRRFHSFTLVATMIL